MPSKDKIGVQNRPYIMTSTQQSSDKPSDHIFRLQFDQSIGMPGSWVDTKTLNYLNTLRDNIYASSSSYDIMMPPGKDAKDPTKGEFSTDDYDFCHHCKQLKNKYLLVSCKYNSCDLAKKMG